MSQEIYSTRWESKKISKESPIYSAEAPDLIFATIASADGADACKT